MLKKKTAVLIIEQDGAATKSIAVPSLLFTHWKKILLSAVGLVAVVLFSTAYIVRQQTSEQYTQRYGKKINELKQLNKKLETEEMNSQMTAEEMKKSFHSIDSTLQRINQKMRSRGLKEIGLKNMGGPIEEDGDNLAELSLFYEKQLKNLDNKLEGMPLGIPHKGPISSPFGYRRNPFTNRGVEMHSGVDLKGNTGDAIKATAKGRVTFAGYQGDYGYVVKVSHSNGFETRYAHLVRTRVKEGQRIEAGEIVGLMGSTGRSTGPHLHYEVLHNARKLNPEKFFRL